MTSPVLLDHKGIPFAPVNKKAPPPKLGDSFGAWAGRDIEHMRLPGGGIVQFDLSKLTVADFRNMRDHYQVNASLAVLSFMQHQSDWHIECEDKKIAAFAEEQMRNNWTYLNRAMSQSNWAGYSPNALQFENEANRFVLDKVKDLIPEECAVKWDTVDGWAPPGQTPPKFKVYGGIRQIGTPYPIPVDNSFWYPMLMENGDYYGRKLLRPAFTSWFFSILVHLFANRYFERFGEPVPIGRAPFDETLQVPGVGEMQGNAYLLKVLQDLRNRSVVVLPNDRTQNSDGKSDFDYEIEYLESQMRGADFERYLTRLDEEISIGLFTPILLLRTADVGSYNLGVGHMQMYLWMLNAMNDDRKIYIDKYILSKLVSINFSPSAPRAKIVFRKLGNANGEMIRELLTALTQADKIKFDYTELGQMAGMTITEVKQTTAPEPEPGGDDDDPDSPATAPATDAAAVIPARRTTATETVGEIVSRVRRQVDAYYKDGGINSDTRLNMGYKKRMANAIGLEPTEKLFKNMDTWLTTACEFASDYENPDEFVASFESALNRNLATVGV